MEFINGKTLRELLQEMQLDRRRVASYLRQTARALDEIHSHGCVIAISSRKPDDSERGCSWRGAGADRFLDRDVKDPDETLHGLSRAAGTLYYMAPEQAIGFVDTSSDIYSLAKVLIEMLTGQRLSSLLPDASMDLPARIREFLAESSFGFSPLT